MSKVVFMGTPDFAVPVLKTLIETQHVVGVVTQPDRPAGRGKQLRPSPVKVAAEAANIPVYQPKSLRSEEAAQPLRDWQPDIIVVAAFGQILRPHVRMELGSNEAIKHAIVGGLGLSVLSLHTLALEGPDGPVAILDVEGFPIMRQWYLVHPKGKELSLVAKAFLTFALELEPRMRERMEAMWPDLSRFMHGSRPSRRKTTRKNR